MRTLDVDEVIVVSGGAFFTGTMPVIQDPFKPNLGTDVYPGPDLSPGRTILSPLLSMLAEAGHYISFSDEGGSADGVTITCKKPSSGADNDGGFGDCWADKGGFSTLALGVFAGLAFLAGNPPLAAVFTALAGMVGAVAAFSCLVHILGDFCWTEHSFLDRLNLLG